MRVVWLPTKLFSSESMLNLFLNSSNSFFLMRAYFFRIRRAIEIKNLENAEIRKKLEEVAKKELVRKIRVRRFYLLNVLLCLSFIYWIILFEIKGESVQNRQLPFLWSDKYSAADRPGSEFPRRVILTPEIRIWLDEISKTVSTKRKVALDVAKKWRRGRRNPIDRWLRRLSSTSREILQDESEKKEKRRRQATQETLE